MNQIIKAGALVCALAMLEWNPAAVAEEKRLGDYIYVPAMSEPSSMGAISLRVEGVKSGENGEKETVEALAGAEFGVYVYSSEGKLTPWANPLLPSEPMRIRTGETETRFSLPQGTEFYLRQERAPEGYTFDSQTLIPVTGGEIVVQNEAQGRLNITVRDQRGEAIEGVRLTATDETGAQTELTTDGNGQAVLLCDREGNYTVSETELPAGVLPAQNDSASAQVALASAVSVVFEHPAPGTVQAAATVVSVNALGEREEKPLAGLTLHIAGQGDVTTDSDGMAQAALPEGSYDVTLSYAGDADILLPFTQGQLIVRGGQTTKVELAAASRMGRIVMQAESGRAVSGGAVSYASEETGEVYGPYAMDADGLAVSDPLPAGVYRVEEITAPKNTQIGETNNETICVEAGQAAQVSVRLLTLENQRFAMVRAEIDDTGARQETALNEPLTAELLTADGGRQTADDVQIQDGSVSLEALSGTYVLRLTESDAASLGVLPQSEPFTLPSREETIAFAAAQTRLVLHSVDEDGNAIAGAAYDVTDSAGQSYTVTTDEMGRAVTPPMAAGEAMIATQSAPEGYDRAAQTTCAAVAGEAGEISLVHARYGLAQFAVSVRKLDANGNAAEEPLSGAQVRIYSVQSGGQSVNDTGILLQTDADGVCSVRLAPGEYAAQTQGIAQGMTAPQAARFTMQNAQQTDVTLTCMDALGGVSVTLTGGTLEQEQMAQVRFELLASDGQTTDLALMDGAFYAGQLAAGTYVLRQTQMPEGYTLSGEQTVTVAGGEVQRVRVPLEEYALLSVSKTGLTFNDKLQTYVVPLTGEYGVYTMENGSLLPYPSASEQTTVWANAAPSEKKAVSVRLPAEPEGTTYYLRELSGAAGFAADETIYEVTLTAGETRVLDCAVSSDRGFFELDLTDISTGAHVSGGRFELLSGDGEAVLDFEMGDSAYRNPMAVLVGTYTLRQIEAAEGYAFCENSEITVEIPPYLTQGGSVASAGMRCLSLPESGTIEGLLDDVYAANAQGLTLLTVDTAAVRRGETLIQPRVQIDISEQSGARVKIESLVLTAPTDENGGRYRARVEYSLTGGGWRPSEAKTTDVLTGPTAVSFADVPNDIDAVRVTYLNAQTGEELAEGGFTPGQITLNVKTGVDGAATLNARTTFDGTLLVQTQADGAKQAIARTAERTDSFGVTGSGMFAAASAGVDGTISGIAFLDSDADGVMDADETARYAGLNVTLLTRAGEVVSACRTDSDGRYAFSPVSGGSYTVQFDGGSGVIFSSGELYSNHVQSAVRDTHYGLSETLVIDGDHSDYIVNAGCIYAGEVYGNVLEQLADGQTVGFGGLNLEMEKSGEEEPAVVMTGDSGAFDFAGMLPGKYDVVLTLPQGYLSADAEDGEIRRTVELAQGDVVDFGTVTMCQSASISGAVHIDDDGDGVIAEGAQPVSDLRVVLLRVKNGHTESIAETRTDENGRYRFDALYAGEYSVLFELDGEWTFTQYGQDSAVYGALTQSGSTQAISLQIGDEVKNIDAGVTIPAQLTVNVFKDTQADGVKGVYEEAFEGIGVTLIHLVNGEDAESVTYRTDAEGNVTFAGVSPGEYAIAYQLPGQWRATKQADAASASAPVSCVPQTTLSSGRSEPFTLTMGQTGVKLYIGAMLSGSISGRVYYDDDADAKLGASELYCRDVKVELLNAAGDTVAAASTAEDGSYAFEGVAPGRYRVRFTAKEADSGFSATERSMAKGGVQQSDDSVSTTRVLTLSGGDTLSEVNAGVVRRGTLTGSVWIDRNGDCVRQAEEELLSGVEVHLMDGAGRFITESTTTDENGRFAFARVAPGSYKLRVDAPEGYVFSGAAQDSVLPLESTRDGRGYSASFTMLGGAKVEGVSFGLLTQGKITGRVWLDGDYDGLMGETAEGLRGATVALLGGDGEEMAQTQSTRTGEFTFDRLMPGTYSVRVTLPEGYVYTVGGADSLALRTDEAAVTIGLGELHMGETLSGVNVGALKPASVGGVVWMDADDDGRRQNGDAGVQGVTVQMRITDGADAGTTLNATTDASGSYRFDGVMPGRAELSFTLADGYAFAKNASGTRRVSVVPMADSVNGQTDGVDILSGENNLDLDVGVVAVGTMAGTVWQDSRYDGVYGKKEAGVSGAWVELLDAASGETLKHAETDENGRYALDFVRAGDYTLRVTLPDGMMFTCGGESAIAETDAGCAQSAAFSVAMGESREAMNVGAIAAASIAGRVTAPNAVITLTQGGTVVAATQTDANGDFELTALRPGQYRVRMALPEDRLFERGAALELTHADAQEGQTGEINLAMGERLTLETITAVETATVGGRAWQDQNTDGVMDAQEPALPGVTVALLDENGGVAAEQTVGEDGRYSFRLIRSGCYSLCFTLPGGELFADQSGEAGGSCVAPVEGGTAATAPMTLEGGQKIDSLNLGAIEAAQIGDTVWLDQNGNGLQDYGEPGLAGVALTLLRVDGDGQADIAAQTVSDEYGYYHFRNLRPGSYSLRVELEEGDTLTFRFGAPLGEIDSDIDPETGVSDVFRLQSGEIRLNIDVGLTERAEK